MGLGWLHHTGYREMQLERTGSSADLQLVELVHEAGESERTNGSDHQSPIITDCRGASDRTCRAKAIVDQHTHGAADQVKALITNVRAGLQHILATAPQFPNGSRWQ